MTEHSNRTETAAQVFNRTALPVFTEFTSRNVVDVNIQRQLANEFTYAFSARTELSKPWLGLLGTEAFAAFLNKREPSPLKATGDAEGLGTITITLTGGIKYDASIARELNDSLVAIFSRVSHQVSFQDMCALDSLGRDVAPLPRLRYLSACAALLNGQLVSQPVELKRLIATLRERAGKAPNEVAFLERVIQTGSLLGDLN